MCLLWMVKVSVGLFTFHPHPPNPPTLTINDNVSFVFGFLPPSPPNSHMFRNPDSDVSYPLCPGVVWLWVGWSSLSSRTPAWSACSCGRERSLRSADARCARTHPPSVCVCVWVRGKAFSSSGWKEAAVYLLPSRTLPQTRPPLLGDVRPG